MKELWQAFLARLIYWLTPKPAEVLTLGTCQCDHLRCCHVKGKYNCTAAVDDSVCACEVYIRKKGDGDDDVPTPTPEQLERMFTK
jgi:hypothetical protein